MPDSPMKVGGFLAALAERFPLAWSESWDAVGLRVGDGDEPLGKVYVTLDADARALEAAGAQGCSTLVTHHPPFLGQLGTLTTDSAAGAFALAAARRGIAVISMHTNLDRSPEGAEELPLRLGLPPGEPLEDSLSEVDVVTAFVPVGARDAVAAAMSVAGAGRIGRYEGCSFTATGAGRFTPRADARPTAGSQGSSVEPEERLEMVTPVGGGPAAAAAARAVHPYEEPVIVVTRALLCRGAARLGRVCAVEETTLRALAIHVGESLGVRSRVWGDPDRIVTRVAVASGSGGSLVGSVVASGAQAMIAGEVRYHDAMAAVASGLALIEAGHDATEWPLVDVLGRACRAIAGDEAVIQASPLMGWWTAERA